MTFIFWSYGEGGARKKEREIGDNQLLSLVDDEGNHVLDIKVDTHRGGVEVRTADGRAIKVLPNVSNSVTVTSEDY